MKTQNVKMMMSLMVVGASLVGCGANKITAQEQSTAVVSDFSSRNPVSTDTQKPLATCNQGSNDDLTASLRQYEDQFGTPRNDYIRVRMNNINDAFSADDFYVAAFRWKANSSGNVHMDTTPLKIRVEKLNSQFFTAVSNYASNLNWASMNAIAENQKVSITNMNDFFEQFSLTVDLQDPLAEYDAIKLVVYQGTTAVSELDMLLPTFYANPNDYKTDPQGGTRAQVLQDIHPFKSMLGQSWSANHYSTEAAKFCF